MTQTNQIREHFLANARRHLLVQETGKGACQCHCESLSHTESVLHAQTGSPAGKTKA